MLRPGLQPTTTTMLFALRTYVGLDFNIARWSWRNSTQQFFPRGSPLGVSIPWPVLERTDDLEGDSVLAVGPAL